MMLPTPCFWPSGIIAVALLSLQFATVQGSPTDCNRTQGIPDLDPLGLNVTEPLTGFVPCDALLTVGLSHAVYMPADPEFPELVNGTWAKNTRKAPYCFVLPANSDELARTLTALQSRSAGDGAGDWHVAIRSGGHGSDNSNNIDTGVTIDLSRFNGTTYDPQTKVASVGTGARWLDVYVELEKQGVTVTGGRQGIVGVGGFVLGGGNSWYTPRTGFTCDTVVNFEIVLPTGELINANSSSHKDLWRALKGGSSNYGVVTRFDLETIPTSNLSVTTRTFDLNHSEAFADAFVGFTELDEPTHADTLLAYMTHGPELNQTIIQLTEVNTLNENTTSFDAFNDIPAFPKAPTTHVSERLIDNANDSSVAASTLNTGALLTVANDRTVILKCIEEHEKLVDELKTFLTNADFRTVVDFQPLPKYFSDISVRKGGNMLGLDRESRARAIFVAGVTLLTPDGESAYARVYQALSAMRAKVKAFAASIDKDEDFIYLNYAHANEDPLGSYGKANVEYMKKVAAKYDPHQFMQKRVPGGFKISRVQ